MQNFITKLLNFQCWCRTDSGVSLTRLAMHYYLSRATRVSRCSRLRPSFFAAIFSAPAVFLLAGLSRSGFEYLNQIPVRSDYLSSPYTLVVAVPLLPARQHATFVPPKLIVLHLRTFFTICLCPSTNYFKISATTLICAFAPVTCSIQISNTPRSRCGTRRGLEVLSLKTV